MGIIVKDKEYSFKELEQEIYRTVCRAGVEITRQILARKDQEIFETVDKEVYHSKGFRPTTIKVQYGSVEYERRVYETSMEDGKKAYIYLLDEALGMKKIGLISENLAEIIADIATETPYRGAADAVSNTTGISISAQGIWDIMQNLGDHIREEEDYDVSRMNAGQDTGRKAVPVLFEEMDGVWIRQQGKHHEKLPMQEVKVASTYEGWDAEKEKQSRSTLVGKHIIAGIEDSKTFHDKREADIRRRYDADRQMLHATEHVEMKKAVYDRYKDGFKDLPVMMNPYDESRSVPNFWLSALLIDREHMGEQVRSGRKAMYRHEPGKSTPTEILETLMKYNVQGRPIWKPTHMQPYYIISIIRLSPGMGMAEPGQMPISQVRL